MSDARRKYLEIQRELGGNEVILSGPLVQADRRTGGQVDEPADLRKGGPAESQDVADAPSARPPDRPSAWQRGAPPIPTVPGLIIQAPVRGLMDSAPPWETLDELVRAVAECRKCFRSMFVGEGPGQTEDETGRPFVGRAGELLTQIIEAIGLTRAAVYIANAVKCRPPQNRKPLPDELGACWPYLERQIELIRPRVLVALGATAAESLLQARRSLTELRGRVHSYRGIPLVVTYHPAALLRNPNWKKPTWDDVRIARQLLDR